MLKRILALVCAFFIVIVSASCANTRANAVLHEKDSIYAIAYSDKMHDIGIKSRQGFVYDVQNGRIVFTKG